MVVEPLSGSGNADIIFTSKGVFCDKAFEGFSYDPLITQYDMITLDGNKLNIGKTDFKNKDVNLVELYDLIQELSELAPKENSVETQNTQYAPYKETYYIESEYED